MISFVLPIVLLAAQDQIQQRPEERPRPAAQLSQPKLLKSKEPHYPDDAVRAGLGGAVVLEAEVDEKGAVTHARVVKGVPPLSEAATRAISEWRYAPLLLDGRPSPFTLTVTINFDRGFQFDLHDLLDSLNSKNEYIRESAVIWLGRARSARNFDYTHIMDVRRRLRLVTETDQSERVRAAAAKALTRLDAR
jgi:TonB family protein